MVCSPTCLTPPSPTATLPANPAAALPANTAAAAALPANAAAALPANAAAAAAAAYAALAPLPPPATATTFMTHHTKLTCNPAWCFGVTLPGYGMGSCMVGLQSLPVKTAHAACGMCQVADNWQGSRSATCRGLTALLLLIHVCSWLQHVYRLRAHSGRGVWRCQIIPSCMMLVTGGADAAVKLWSLSHLLPAGLPPGRSSCPGSPHEMGSVPQVGILFDGQPTCRNASDELGRHHQAASLRAAPQSGGPAIKDKIPVLHQSFTLEGTCSDAYNACLAGSGNSKTAVDSKAEWVRCIQLLGPDSLLVATNKGLIHFVDIAHCVETWHLLHACPMGGPFTCMIEIVSPGKEAVTSSSNNNNSSSSSRSSSLGVTIGSHQNADYTTCSRRHLALEEPKELSCSGSDGHASSSTAVIAAGHINGYVGVFRLSGVPPQQPAPSMLQTEQQQLCLDTQQQDQNASVSHDHSRQQQQSLQALQQAPLPHLSRCLWWSAHNGEAVHSVHTSRLLPDSSLFTTPSTPCVRWWVLSTSTLLSCEAADPHGNAEQTVDDCSVHDWSGGLLCSEDRPCQGASGVGCQYGTPSSSLDWPETKGNSHSSALPMQQAPLLLAEATAPGSSRFTAVEVCANGSVLVCGNQKGCVYVFDVPSSCWSIARQHQEHLHTLSSSNDSTARGCLQLRSNAQLPLFQLQLLHCFPSAHGSSTVNLIQPQLGKSDFQTSGRDGCICQFRLISGEAQKSVILCTTQRLQGLTSQEYICPTQPHQQPVPLPAASKPQLHTHMPESTACSLGAQSTHLPPSLVAGFQSTNFVVRDTNAQLVVFKAPCGGPRRPQSFWCDAQGNMVFAFSKDHKLHVHKTKPIAASDSRHTLQHAEDPADAHTQPDQSVQPAQAQLVATDSIVAKADQMLAGDIPVLPELSNRHIASAVDMVSHSNVVAAPLSHPATATTAVVDAEVCTSATSALAGVANGHAAVLQPVHHGREVNAVCILPAAAMPILSTCAQPSDNLPGLINASSTVAGSVAVLSASEDGTVRSITYDAQVAHVHHCIGSTCCTTSVHADSAAPDLCDRSRSMKHVAVHTSVYSAAQTPVIGTSPSSVNDDVACAVANPVSLSSSVNAGFVGAAAQPCTNAVSFSHSQCLGQHASGSAMKCLTAARIPHTAGDWLVVAGGAQEVMLSWKVSWHNYVGQDTVTHADPIETLTLTCPTSSGTPQHSKPILPQLLPGPSTSKLLDCSATTHTKSAAPAAPRPVVKLICSREPARGFRPKSTAKGQNSVKADARYLAVDVIHVHTAGAPSAHTGHLSALIAAARSDSLLELLHLDGTNCTWQVVAVLECHTHPVLSMTSIRQQSTAQSAALAPCADPASTAQACSMSSTASQLCSSTPGGDMDDSSSGPPLVLLLTGASDGGVALWDLTHLVDLLQDDSTFSTSLPCTTHEQPCSTDKVASVQGPSIRHVLPVLTCEAVHQSGVNALCVGWADPLAEDAHGQHLMVATGGDDQAVAVMRIAVSSTAPITDPHLLTDAKVGLDKAAEGSQMMHSCDSQVGLQGAREQPGVNDTAKAAAAVPAIACRIVASMLLSNAHSSAIRGMAMVGPLLFSTGLDERVRCWRVVVVTDDAATGDDASHSLCLQACSRADGQALAVGKVASSSKGSMISTHTPSESSAHGGPSATSNQQRFGSQAGGYRTGVFLELVGSCIADVPEPSSIDALKCTAMPGHVWVAVGGRGLQLLLFAV
eukprot:jgi/Chrzof1/1851/Cz10g23200.t1